MKSINLLHLSDLHLGWKERGFYYENFREIFYKDLLKLSKKCGKFNIVVFSGDLTNSGKEDQFFELNKIFKDLWDFFKRDIKCVPYFVCVPGNHDLKRPQKFELHKETIEKNYFKNEEFRDQFWSNIESNEYGKFINNECFQAYENWHENLSLPLPKDQKRGIIFGDISAQFNLNNIKICIIGLNSAFLQLGEGNYKGRLDLSTKQLYSVCENNTFEWLRDFDFPILLTHHGNDWLNDNSRETFLSEIYHPNRFVFHLYGHVHFGKTEIEKISGSQARRFGISKSLFGINSFYSHDGKRKLKRDHGYSLINLTIDDFLRKCKIYPRASAERSGKFIEMDKDTSYTLDDDESFVMFEGPSLKKTKAGFIRSQTKKNKTADFPYREKIDDIYRCRRIFLTDKRHLDHLKEIEDHVVKLWGRHKGPLWQPLHDFNHNREVEASLYKLIPANKSNKLESFEWFILLSSVWLHEIGMIIGLFKDDIKNYNENPDGFVRYVRENHHKRAANYLDYIEDKKILPCIKIFKNDIKGCCFYHRKKTDISKIKSEKYNNEQNNLILFISYLRLALAIHLDPHLEDEHLFNLMHTPGLSWEDRFHWQKRKWIDDIIVQHDNYLITVNAFSPPEDSDLKDIFPEKLIEDLREGLILVRDYLAQGGISFFYDVKYKNAGVKSDLDHINDMKLIRSNIDLEELSSASEAYSTVLNTYEKFTSSDVKSFKLIYSYFQSTEKVLEARRCHILMGNLNAKLREIFSDKASTENDKISKIKKIITEKIKTREQIRTKIGENSKPFLLDKKSILLYGYSSMVIDALSSMPKDVMSETEIYVGECRGKTQFDLVGQMVYNDGLHYIKKIKDLPFNKIYFIPDISIANIMHRGLIKKVLFGANGIDAASGKFGHTCGHLMIADLASIYDIPLYVIADSSKIGKLEDKGHINREINWVPKSKLYEEMQEKIIPLNPREDTIESYKISMIITENGIQFPKKEKCLAKMLLFNKETNSNIANRS